VTASAAAKVRLRAELRERLARQPVADRERKSETIAATRKAPFPRTGGRYDFFAGPSEQPSLRRKLLKKRDNYVQPWFSIRPDNCH